MNQVDESRITLPQGKANGRGQIRVVLKPMSLALLSGGIAILATLAFSNSGISGKSQGNGGAATRSGAETPGEMATLKCDGCGHVFSSPREVAQALADPLASQKGIQVLPAENALLKGAQVEKGRAWQGFLGTGVASLQAKGDSVEWQVPVITAGTYQLAIRYANSGGAGGALRVIRVGDAASTKTEVLAEKLPLPRTGTKRDWEYVSVQATLESGVHRIQVEGLAGQGIALDGLAVVAVSAQPHSEHGAQVR